MRTIAYCTDCASILFKLSHCYTVDVSKEFEWMGNSPTDREYTPADETYRDGSSFDKCTLCGEEVTVTLDISDEVARILLEAKKNHNSISIVLTEEELDSSTFTDATRLKKEILRQSL
jgi:hypothetical protein